MSNPEDLSQDLGKGDRWRAGAAQEYQGFVLPPEQVSQQMTKSEVTQSIPN